MKLNFVYIGNDLDGNPKTDLPTGEIQAIQVKFDDGEKHFIPIIPNRWETIDDVKEVWVYGQGWFKLGKRKRYTIPVFDGEAEHFNDYLEKYGIDVMCYCLNGDSFNRSGDCCHIRYRNEFRTLCHFGVEKFNEYSTLFKQMKELQTKWFTEKYLPLFKEHGWGDGIIDDYIFEPCYTIYGVPFMVMDVLEDEKKMDNLYHKIRYWELYKKHHKYPEYEIRKQKAVDYKGDRSYGDLRWDTEYDNLCEYANEIDHIIHTDITKRIDKEVENGCRNYPIQMSAKMRKLYGKKIEEIYQKLVELK